MKALVNIILTEDVETEEIVLLKEDRMGLFDRQVIVVVKRLTKRMKQSN
jgi:hypothetical protein